MLLDFLGKGLIDYSANGVFGQMEVLWSQERYLFLQFLWNFLHAMWLTGLAVTHINLISRNLTTNEMVNKHKYEYLRVPKAEGEPDEEEESHGHSHGGGGGGGSSSNHGHSHGGQMESGFKFHNPFRRNCVANWRELYHCNPVDYYNVHSVEQLTYARSQQHV